VKSGLGRISVKENLPIMGETMHHKLKKKIKLGNIIGREYFHKHFICSSQKMVENVH
jgi:hypothetical protein